MMILVLETRSARNRSRLQQLSRNNVIYFPLDNSIVQQLVKMNEKLYVTMHVTSLWQMHLQDSANLVR